MEAPLALAGFNDNESFLKATSMPRSGELRVLWGPHILRKDLFPQDQRTPLNRPASVKENLKSYYIKDYSISI